MYLRVFNFTEKMESSSKKEIIEFEVETTHKSKYFIKFIFRNNKTSTKIT